MGKVATSNAGAGYQLGEGGSYPWLPARPVWMSQVVSGWRRGGKLPLAAGGISLAVVGRRRDLVSVAAVADRRRDPLVLWVGRRRRAKEEGLELEQDPCSGAAMENLEISFA